MTLLRISLVILLLLSAPAALLAQQKDISIRIVQDDVAYQLNEFETRLVLEKEGFKIQVLLSKAEGVYVFASFGDSVFKVSQAEPVPGFKNLPNMVMAEEEFNKNKELIISKEGWSYWFYDSELSWHRFNKKLVFLDSGKVVGIKSIKQLYLSDEKEEVKVKDIDKPLYLFFVAVAEKDEKGMPVKEFMRRKLKIEWKSEDD
jgi:hypothetical protein